MFRRHALVALSCLPIVASLTSGCSEDEKATPQVIFSSSLSRGAGTDCQDSGPLFAIGSFGEPALKETAQPKKDGEAFDQGVVSVSCSVTSAGADAFNVQASVDLSGATGGLFRIDGKFTAVAPPDGITGIHAIFTSRRTTNTYEQTDSTCVVRYTTQYQGIASGRVWGEVICPTASNAGAQRSCTATAQFRFENCTQ